jgi:YlmC/YmxH family sporulation protein
MDRKLEKTTFDDMRKKDVINVADGVCMGRICDMEIDVNDCEGRLTAIIVPGPAKLFGILRSDEELVIPYKCLRKIGEDVILVEVLPREPVFIDR